MWLKNSIVYIIYVQWCANWSATPVHEYQFVSKLIIRIPTFKYALK